VTPYQAAALANLRALGGRLDAEALQGAAETVLDPLLAGMRQLHDGIVGHLADQLGTARPPRARVPAPLRVRGHRTRR
jgi:hypothetical protein